MSRRTDDRADAAPSSRETVPPHADAADGETARASNWWRRTDAGARQDIAAGHWYAALERLTNPEAPRALRFLNPADVRSLEAAVLDAAGSGHVDFALREVIFAARRVTQDDAVAPEAKAGAARVMAWAISQALAPYGRDRVAFSLAYGTARFGDDRTDARTRAPVQEMNFEEAAAALAATRPDLETWLYERRLVRKCAELRALQDDWSRFLDDLRRVVVSGRCTAGGQLVEAPPGTSVRIDPARPPDDDGLVVESGTGSRRCLRVVRWRDLSPAAITEALVVPNAGVLAGETLAGLARVFVEMGDERAAAACLARVAGPGSSGVRETLGREIEALASLREVGGGSLPRDARRAPGIEAWLERHRNSDIAQSIGGLGAQDLGLLDDAAIDAYLEGGVLWAPEQWREVGRRCVDVRRCRRDGIDGWEIESDHFTVATDVSAVFAAQASVLLDAAYEQVALVLDLHPAERQSAVIFARREDYQALSHDRSGGHWSSAVNGLRTYLWDPGESRFSRFSSSILVHEATHAVLGTGLRGPVPAWMHEGLAGYFERWNPARSTRANDEATGTSLPHTSRIRKEAADNSLPDLRALLAMDSHWDVDGFGPRTIARYDAAQTLFVHLYADATRRSFVGRFLRAARDGDPPARTLTGAEVAEIEESWMRFVRGESP